VDIILKLGNRNWRSSESRNCYELHNYLIRFLRGNNESRFHQFHEWMRLKKSRDLNSSVASKRTNCRLRLLPRYLFSGSSKLILQGDSPGGSSPGDYPLLQESASMRNFFFVYVFPRGNTFFATFRPIHAQKRILSVIDQREITFFPSYISFWEAGQINWGLGVKGLQPSVLLRCAQLSFVKSPRR